MGIILKENEIYTDKFGNVGSEYYGCINQFNGNKDNHEVAFVFELYKNKSAKDSGFGSVNQFTYTVSGDRYVEWFGIPVLTTNTNPYKQAYLYLLQLKNAEGVLIWEKWKTDE